MGKFDARLAELVQDEVLARLEGEDALLVVTGRELWIIGADSGHSAPLSEISRIRRGDGGFVQVSSQDATLLEIPIRGFPVDELKAFLETIKSLVLRARAASPATPAPTKPVSEHPAPPATEQPSASAQPSFPEPVRHERLPTPKPDHLLGGQERPPQALTPIPPSQTAESGAYPLDRPKKRRMAGFFLKALSLLTLLALMGFLATNQGGDPLLLLLLALMGLGLVVVEWFLSQTV